MSVVDFLFDIPPLLFEVLKRFVDFMSSPAPSVVQRIFSLFLMMVLDVVELFEEFAGLDLSTLIYYVHDVWELFLDAPFAFWILAFYFTCGFVVALVFFVLDVADRIIPF